MRRSPLSVTSAVVAWSGSAYLMWLEALAVELGEPDARWSVGDVEVKDGPDECQAALLTGEPAITFVPSLHLAE